MPTRRDDPMDSNKAHAFLPRLAVAGILALHASLLAYIAATTAPVFDEPAHLVSGLSHWEFGNLDLYRVNPPPLRMIASLPVYLFADYEMDWKDVRDDPYVRSEFKAGRVFLRKNGERSFRYLMLSRMMLIPVSCLGAWVCFLWSRQLYGVSAGFVSLLLWCFSPNILAWGATIIPDLSAAAFGVMAVYTFWRWLREPTWKRAVYAGLTLGVAQLAKTTWIILFALFPIIWFMWRSPRQHGHSLAPPAKQFAAMPLLAICVLNTGYAFEHSFRRLDDFVFISTTLAGDNVATEGGNRFSGTLLGQLPVPFPSNYVRGIDVQKHDFETPSWSYLRGEQKRGGWWYYYLYGLLVKTPLGTLALLVLAFILLASATTYRQPWRDELVLLLPVVAVLVLVSSQTAFSRNYRYVLPLLPFLFIHASRLGRAFEIDGLPVRLASGVFLAASVISSLLVFPHSLSYFNCAVGGPIGGKYHLLDANIDWGQDLLKLKRWIDGNPEANPIGVAYFGIATPALAGIDATAVPYGPGFEYEGDDPGPQPGWYAVSVNHLMGYRHYDIDRPKYVYLQRFEPVATIGYSIYVYRITEADVAEYQALR